MQLFEFGAIIIHKSKIENHTTQTQKLAFAQLHYTYIAKQIKQYIIMLLTELNSHVTCNSCRFMSLNSV